MSVTLSELWSIYQELGILEPEHRIRLVQHRKTYKLYVLKEYDQYDSGVFFWLQAHPVANMPQIIEVVQESGRLYVVEEYIPGETLQELLDTQGCFDENTVADYTVQLCAILTELHSAQPPIIHRDIKPSNIIISSDGVLKLIDVNAAKRYTEGAERDTALLGTMGFAAPEQYGISSSSVQTDLFAVGALMNVMLCGALPTAQSAGGNLERIIRKCLELNPTNRYHSAEELANAVKNTKENENRAETGWRHYLPPGFRSENPILMVFALAGYILLIALGIASGSSKDTNPVNLVIDRIFLCGMFLSVVLFSGNYLDVQRYVPFAKSKKLWLRIIVISLADVAIVFLFGFGATLFEGLLFKNVG